MWPSRQRQAARGVVPGRQTLRAAQHGWRCGRAAGPPPRRLRREPPPGHPPRARALTAPGPPALRCAARRREGFEDGVGAREGRGKGAGRGAALQKSRSLRRAKRPVRRGEGRRAARAGQGGPWLWRRVGREQWSPMPGGARARVDGWTGGARDAASRRRQGIWRYPPPFRASGDTRA